MIKPRTIKGKTQTQKGSVDFRNRFCDYFLINAADL